MRERDRLGFDCCMAQVTSHPLTTGLVSPIIVPDRLMYKQGDEWMERVEGRLAERRTHKRADPPVMGYIHTF